MDKMSQAELQYAAQDAAECMNLAVADRRVEAMSKYAGQLNAYAAEYRARFGKDITVRL